jgi:hypothetical protein
LTLFDASITILALPGGEMGKTAVYEILNTRPITKVSLLLLHLLIFLERFTGRERPKTNTNSWKVNSNMLKKRVLLNLISPRTA